MSTASYAADTSLPQDAPLVPAPPTAQESDTVGAGSFLSSQFARVSGDHDKAMRYLEQVLKEDPENMEIAGQLLILKLMTGDVPAAINLAKALKDIDNHELIVDLLLALEQARLGQFQPAAEQLQDVQNATYDTLWIPLIQAWLDIGQGQLKQPVEAIDFIQDTSKIPPFLYYQLALINDFAGFTDAAERQYKLATDPLAQAPYRAVEALINFYQRNGKKAEAQQLAADYAAARPPAVKLITPSEDGTYYPDRVVSSVQQGLSEVLFTMASVLYSVDSNYDTLLYLQMALHLRPDFPPAWLMLGNAFENAGDFGRAAQAYSMVKSDSVFYQRALLRKAFILDKQGNTEQAVRMLEQMAEQHPLSSDPYIAKGDLLRTKSHFTDAAEAYTQAIARIGTLETEHWALLFARGACYERMGEYQLAERDFQQALQLNPAQPEVLNYLGFMWLVQEQHVPDAVAMIEQAYEQRPDQAHIIDSLGWARYKTGRLAEAVEILERAVSLMPNDPSINDHLGDAYWHSDRKMEARFQWKRALTYTSARKEAEALAAKIENGLPAYRFVKLEVPEAHAREAGAAPPIE